MTTSTATTTADTLAPPPLADGRPDGWSVTLAIPLAEFGKTLADPGLDRWFEGFAERNSDSCYTYAISAEGFLLITPLVGMPGVLHQGAIAATLGIWADGHGGFAFPAGARFALPDGSRIGPDAAWVREERGSELLLPDNRPFPRIAPDFIVEVQSLSNSRAELVDKINLFLTYGTRLAWLIDAADRVVVRFRPNREPETLRDPEFIDGDEDILPGFRFPVRARIFDYMIGTETPL